MFNPSIFYEIFCALFLLSLAAVLIYFVFKEQKRAKESHDRFVEAFKTISQELPQIRSYLCDFVCEYVKPKD